MATVGIAGEPAALVRVPGPGELPAAAKGVADSGVMRLHLVDGTFELYRAHFSKRPAHAQKATRGLAQSLLALLLDAAEQVTHIAIAFDNPIRSFRNDLFAAYKSDEGVPPELRAQFDSAEDAARAAGVVVWSMREFEADDALATAAARYGSQVDQVRILTPDKDLGQCLEGDHVVQVDVIRKRVTNEAALRERRGVKPASIPDLLALTGDDADGIPGLPGFGDRTAAALLARYEHLEGIPLDGRGWPDAVRGADRLAATLRARLADVLLYRELATLRRDVPLRETLEDLRYRGPDENRIREILARDAPPPAVP
jgi:5'-3' exonuclease